MSQNSEIARIAHRMQLRTERRQDHDGGPARRACASPDRDPFRFPELDAILAAAPHCDAWIGTHKLKGKWLWTVDSEMWCGDLRLAAMPTHPTPNPTPAGNRSLGATLGVEGPGLACTPHLVFVGAAFGVMLKGHVPLLT